MWSKPLHPRSLAFKTVERMSIRRVFTSALNHFGAVSFGCDILHTQSRDLKQNACPALRANLNLSIIMALKAGTGVLWNTSK